MKHGIALLVRKPLVLEIVRFPERAELSATALDKFNQPLFLCQHFFRREPFTPIGLFFDKIASQQFPFDRFHVHVAESIAKRLTQQFLVA